MAAQMSDRMERVAIRICRNATPDFATESLQPSQEPDSCAGQLSQGLFRYRGEWCSCVCYCNGCVVIRGEVVD